MNNAGGQANEIIDSVAARFASRIVTPVLIAALTFFLHQAYSEMRADISDNARVSNALLVEVAKINERVKYLEQHMMVRQGSVAIPETLTRAPTRQLREE